MTVNFFDYILYVSAVLTQGQSIYGTIVSNL